MAIAYQSIGNSPGATSTTCVITAPTGITVGDHLTAIIAVRSTSITITPASGFTQIQAQTSQTNVGLRVYEKIADSGDAAAADFTFTLSGSERNIGSMVRLNGNATTSYDAGNTGNSTNSTTTTPTFAGFTPTVGDCIYIMCASNTQGSANYADWAMTTSNPGFTERADLVYTNSTSIHLGVAVSAVRTQSTATGDFSYTQGNEGHSEIVVAVAPYVASGPANLKSLDTNVKANIKSYNTNLLANIKSINGNA